MRFCIHYSVYRYYLPKKGSPEEGHICRSLISGHELFPVIEKIKDKPDKGKIFCYKLVPQTKMEAHLASWEASATVIEERLFGPATLKSGVIVYPCSQSGCWVFYSCQILRRKYFFVLCSQRQKTLKCDQCNMAFCTNKKLIFHKNITHGEVFECEKCGKFFMTRFNMNRHMNAKHQS